MLLAKISRPNIATAVRSVTHPTHDATWEDWRAMIKILGYLRETKDLGLKLTGKGGHLVGYTDSNHATDREDRESVSRGTIVYRDSCIRWFFRTERWVSTSSAEAECISLAECSMGAMFVHHFLTFLEAGARVRPVVLQKDNEGASVQYRTR